MPSCWCGNARFFFWQGDEGPGSLLSYLKRKNWANALSVDESSATDDFMIFEVLQYHLVCVCFDFVRARAASTVSWKKEPNILQTLDFLSFYVITQSARDLRLICGALPLVHDLKLVLCTLESLHTMACAAKDPSEMKLAY